MKELADVRFDSDVYFDRIYPEKVRALSRVHWTPLRVVRQAVGFLAGDEGTRVLDIGSGVGKFCLAAAQCRPGSFFSGVEQRGDLVDTANEARKELGLDNVSFIHGNFTQVDFERYDAFYFYNSFHENLDGTDKIDDRLVYTEALYDYYTRYLYRQLDRLPAGARLVTYHSMDAEVPRDFHRVEEAFSGLLKFWMKV
ncbi:class I SAM-dependent methyltransferase [Dinghuibacter silviterrae]|uniref:Methyltransferase family protein n=1 Tax=Dinghuibacter silviterrae TaxID=1539049 RepID=A0A4R8DIM9_9BACT|nr:class I SAM-dependent methyltransferase [Dinghuibacter silviterrae]TDW96840.1 methyltransferase family protein [Dinghuibacter silviterrae]